MLARRLAGPLLAVLLVGSTGCTGTNADPQSSGGASSGGERASRATDSNLQAERSSDAATAGKPAGQTADQPDGKRSGESDGKPDDKPDNKPDGKTTGQSAGEAGAADRSHDAPVAPPGVRPVSRRPAIPGQPLEISFDDLVIGMQADVVYRPWMLTDRAKEVDGQRVKLVGYIHGGVDKIKNLTEVILLRNRECKFGPGGQADHLVRVMLKPGVKVNYTDNAVEVQGLIKVNPWQGPDGNTWSLYDLEGEAAKDLKRK